jgi:hypothetical protein
MTSDTTNTFLTEPEASTLPKQDPSIGSGPKTLKNSSDTHYVYIKYYPSFVVLVAALHTYFIMWHTEY